jgi:hypothetical protein
VLGEPAIHVSMVSGFRCAAATSGCGALRPSTLRESDFPHPAWEQQPVRDGPRPFLRFVGLAAPVAFDNRQHSGQCSHPNESESCGTREIYLESAGTQWQRGWPCLAAWGSLSGINPYLNPPETAPMWVVLNLAREARQITPATQAAPVVDRC